MNAGASPTLTVVVPSRKAWRSSQAAVVALLEQVRRAGGEVLLVTGQADGAPAAPPEGLRVLHVPGNDVFVCRAHAIVAARGEIVSVLEDHCFAPEGWAERLLAAWKAHPDAGGLVHVIDNGAPGLLDSASFLLTWAPFIGPMREPPADRCPAPGVVSYRRSVLPTQVPPSGWFEYELPTALRAAGRLVADDSISVRHTQALGLRAFALQFHAGRGFTGLRSHRATQGTRRDRLLETAKIPGRLVGQTYRALRASPTWRPGTLLLAVTGLYALCNAVGQAVGVVTGSAGSSLAELE